MNYCSKHVYFNMLLNMFLLMSCGDLKKFDQAEEISPYCLYFKYVVQTIPISD